MQDTYTILNYNGDVVERGLSLEGAALTLLTHDGNEFEVRPEEDGEGYCLWHTRRQGWPLAKTNLLSLKPEAGAATSDIYHQVVNKAEAWNNGWAYTDEAYEELLAEMAVEDAAE